MQLLSRHGYRFNEYFRAWEQHIANWPIDRAFRKQWNIGLTAEGNPEDDYVRIGIGFRLNANLSDRGIDDYISFQQDVQRRPDQFNQIFDHLGSYHEIGNEDPWTPGRSGEVPGQLAAIISGDEFPVLGWRFFGKKLRVCRNVERAIISSHERLLGEILTVYNHIQGSGFGNNTS